METNKTFQAAIRDAQAGVYDKWYRYYGDEQSYNAGIQYAIKHYGCVINHFIEVNYL